jgi:hypothetical protein
VPIWVIAQPEHLPVFFIAPGGVVQAVGCVEVGFSENGDAHGKKGWGRGALVFYIRSGRKPELAIKRNFKEIVRWKITAYNQNSYTFAVENT